MLKVAEFKAIIVVYNSIGIVVAAPPEALNGMDGCFCEDNEFENLPSEKGIYICDVDFYFEQGYCDGYPADGESDWKYHIRTAQLLNGLPQVDTSWIVLEPKGDK